MGMFGNKYLETPDLSGKQKKAEQTLKDNNLKWVNI